MLLLALVAAAPVAAPPRPMLPRVAPAAPAVPPQVTFAQAKGMTMTTPSGVRLEVLVPSQGPSPGPDNAVLITYEGRLVADGKVFDKAEQPVGMMVSGTVPGFAEALQAMRKGGTYKIIIPPQLAYGAKGAGDGVIPPNAALEFTVTLLDIGRPSPPVVVTTPPPH